MNNQEIKIKIAESHEDFSNAKKLILEFSECLEMDLSFQNFNEEMNSLNKMYGEENGKLLLSFVNAIPAGVAGIRKFYGDECELKRMFVKPEYRNLGIGKLLLKEAIEAAKKLNYKIIKLDTTGFMKAAIKLYTNNGFTEIPAYRYNPHEEAKYFELKIKE